jgi:hypothetical protein
MSEKVGIADLSFMAVTKPMSMTNQYISQQGQNAKFNIPAI